MLDDLAEAEEALSARTHRHADGCAPPHSFIYQDFLPALPRFLERYPQLDVELVLTDRAVNLVEEGIDCACAPCRCPTIPRSSRGASRNGSGSPAHPANISSGTAGRRIRKSSSTTTASASSRRPMGARRPGSSKGATDVSFTPRGNLGVTSAEGAAAAAAVGIGIAQVSHVLALPGLRSGALEPLLVDSGRRGRAAPGRVSEQPLSRREGRAFTDFVAEIYPADFWWSEVERWTAS